MLVIIAALGPFRPDVQDARATEDPIVFVKTKQTQVSALLRQPPGSARDKRLSQVLDTMLDYDQLAQQSMANHWDELTPAQRKEFTELLKELVRRSYERNIKGILDWRVEYLGQDSDPNGVTVHTKATSKTNPREEPISIDYKLVEVSDNWRVYDIITEGSSLVSNYRNQFNHIFQKDGYPGVIRRMKSKIAKGGEAHAK
jgi:phospholipid transport system substrate-binding protein